MRPPNTAVLLCNPFGEEAARAHRTYRILASQLERSGYPVLRFDYYGTGDSMGNSTEVSIAGWIDDIALAANELTTTTGARKVVAIGLRLGATLATLATTRVGLRLRHLVLWDPVVNGAEYLHELVATHRTYMVQEMGPRYRLGRVSAAVPQGVLGTPIDTRLEQEMSAIQLAGEELRSDHVTVISTRQALAIEYLRVCLPASPSTRWIDMPKSAAWNSDAALNAQVVPMDVVHAVVARVEEISQ